MFTSGKPTTELLLVGMAPAGCTPNDNGGTDDLASTLHASYNDPPESNGWSQVG